MTLTERTIRDRLDGKISRVPNGFWNYSTLSMAIKIIIEEKFGIKPENIPVENMKNPLLTRVYNEYSFIDSIMRCRNLKFIDIVINSYGMTLDDWYLFNNIEKLYELKLRGYRFPVGINNYDYTKKVYYKLFLYGLAKENMILTRSNILEISKQVFVKLGWERFNEGFADSLFAIPFRGSGTECIYISDVLCKCFPHSFQLHDFKSSFADIKYAINYEIHVRYEMMHEEFLNIDGLIIWSRYNSRQIKNLIAKYYSNTNNTIEDFKNLVEWEGPLYDKLMKELEYVKTHKVPFGYKDGDTSELKLNI